MSTTLNIDKDLVPGSSIKFEVNMSMYGEESDDLLIPMNVPKACPLVNKLKGIDVKIENREKIKTGNNRSFGFSKFKKKEDISANRYKLLVVLDANKVPGSLDTDDEVQLSCADAFGASQPLGTILGSHRSKKNYLYLSVSKSDYPLVDLDTSTTGTVTEVKKKIKVKNVTISVPQKFMDGLVAEKPPGSAKKGMVEDIIIFAYKQFEGKNKTSIKHKLMVNDDPVNAKNPPARSDIIDYRGKKSYSKDFIINDENGRNVIGYIAVARYTYDGESWQGEWLQKDSNKNVLWGKAVK